MKQIVGKLLVASCLFSYVSATTSTEVFAKYRNGHFIETGSYFGDGIQKALDAGYKEIYSVELSPIYYEHSTKRFVNQKNVHIFLGNSEHLLFQIIQKIKVPVTFWLDGHYSGGDTAQGKGNTPLLGELEAIKKHPIKTHTILIDDVRELGTTSMDNISLEAVIKKLKEINPNYTIKFEDGYVPGDVLVAYIPK